MHPLVARIHPSIRTGFVAWLFCRFIVWTTAGLADNSALSALAGDAYGRGAPMWVALVDGVQALAGVVAVDAPVLLVALGEVALLAGAIAVYRFARKDELPHTAERATWLWMAVPSMAVTVPVSAWSFAVASVAVGLAALRGTRWLAATVAIGVAAGFRPEILLLGPGIAWMAWHHYEPAKQPGWGPWTVGLTPLVAFTGFVGAATVLAGRWGVSMRSLQTESGWRADWAWHGFHAEAGLLVVGLCGALAIGLLLGALKRVSGAWIVVSVPPLIWPLFHDPVFPATGPVLFAVPAFVVLGRALDDRRLERPVLAAAIAGLVMCL